MFTKRLMPAALDPAILVGVSAYVNKGDWDINNSKVRRFKSALKKSLVVTQGNRCVYCERLLTMNCPEIEHIALKAVFPEWQFEPSNLAYACHWCNST